MGDTPKTPKGRAPSFTPHPMDQENRRAYWQIYKCKKKQISLTLSLPEYRYWQSLAKNNGTTVGKQIKAEASAYQRQARAPNAELLTELSQHTYVLRGIANNLNQIARHTNTFSQWLLRHETLHLLQKLERVAERFIEDARTSR